MHRFFSSSNESSFFTDPKKVSLTVLGAGTFSLLIPACLKLASLAHKKHDSEQDFNEANNDYMDALEEFNTADDHLIEAKQRILDLDCAMAHYPNFNDRMSNFLQLVNGSLALPASDGLSSVWNLDFLPDTYTREQRVNKRSWYESQLKYEKYYGFHGERICGEKKNYCRAWGWHTVQVERFYNEFTRIENQFRNIATGEGVSIDLDCGFYSRKFQAGPPEKYVTYQSLPIQSGDRESGTTYVDITNLYSSRVPERFQLDGTETTTMASLGYEDTKAEAAHELATQLYQFLAASIAAFNLAGMDYSKLQERISTSIPGLIEAIHEVNETVQANALVLAQKQQTFEDADDEYKTGLSLWLPLLLLVPGGLALLAYVLIYRFNSAQASETTSANVGEWDDTGSNPTATNFSPV